MKDMTTERERFDSWLSQFRELAPLHGPVLWEAWQAALSAPPDTENRRAQPAAPADAAPSVAPEPPRSAQLMICTGCGRQSDDEPIKTPSIACCPDNRYRTLRELLSEIDTLRRTHPPRAPLTEEFWLMLDTALDALKYHQEQTRPIELTRVTIAAVETFISAHGIGGK